MLTSSKETNQYHLVKTWQHTSPSGGDSSFSSSLSSPQFAPYTSSAEAVLQLLQPWGTVSSTWEPLTGDVSQQLVQNEW